MSASGLLVAGTSSDAGKSLVVTGLCRALARRGVSVAPFKAQNMSNNSAVCADGAEIGRAQHLQAQAARVEPESAMNPVLLKPGSDRRSHVVVRGRPAGTLEAGEYATGRTHLAAAAYEAYASLAERFELVVCEGAGSPAEINLRSGDYVNLGLARRFDLPVVVVGDIDRGGVFAALYGTVALLDAADRATIRSFLVNKFRGDPAVLQPGLDELTRRTGVPFAGVLPWLTDVWLDAEDTLEVGAWRRTSRSPNPSDRPLSPSDRSLSPSDRFLNPSDRSLSLSKGALSPSDRSLSLLDRSLSLSKGALRVAVIRLPRVSNLTDVEALAAEPGVDVLVTIDPDVVDGADLVVLPGSRATVSDLGWLRATGLAAVLAERAERAAPVLGICGGYQMLAGRIDDPDTDSGVVAGLGLLPTRVDVAAEKILGRPVGTWAGHRVAAYEIHHGVATVTDEAEPFLDGVRRDQVWGTMWHGSLENDDFRRAWLTGVAAAAGSGWRPEPGAATYGARREAMIETLADAVDAHVDLDLVLAGTRVALGARP